MKLLPAAVSAGFRPWITVALTAGAFLGTAPAAQAQSDCRIRVVLGNVGAHPISVRTSSIEARSRVAGIAGPWRRLTSGGWGDGRANHSYAPASGHVSHYTPQLGCNDPRQYRLRYTCDAGPRAGRGYDIRWPEAGNSWLSSQNLTIPIGGRC
jgi:hypothetical protein